MKGKEFFETYPLYKKLSAENLLFTNERDVHMMAFASGIPSKPREYISKPAINDVCPICKSVQTYNMGGEYGEDGYNFSGKVFRADYICSGCGYDRKVFFLHFFDVIDKEEEKELFVQKIGQFPSFSIKGDAYIEDLLGKHKDYFKKGLINESQGYGIGAFSYFRRITEDIIDELLDSITDLLEEKDREKYTVALEKTKQTRVTQEKINLVKDLLPASLRSNGINPLEALHSALSQGLHEESDESCLEYADAIKKVLVYLVNQVIKKKEDSRVFTEGMKKLLEKRTKASLQKSGK